MVFGVDSGLGFVAFEFFVFFQRVTQGLEDFNIASILFEFFFSFHDGKIKFAIGFGFGEKLSVVVKEPSQFRCS